MFNEQFPELNKNSIDNALRIAKTTMESTERLIKLQLEAAKLAIEENAKNAKELSEVQDLQEVMALRAKLAGSSVENALSYSRKVYEVAAQAQAELAELFEEGLSAYTENLVNVVEKTTGSAPAGSDLAIAALKSTVAATQAVVDGMSKAARQVASAAGAKAAPPAAAAKAPKKAY